MSSANIPISTDGTTPAGKSPTIKPLTPVVWWLRELIAVAVWVFVGIKIFVFDIDRFVLSAIAPGLLPALDYRFVVLLVVPAVLWLFLTNATFFRIVGYIIGFPIVILLWKLPRLMVRNWALTIAFSPALHSLITTFRWSFILFTAALISGLAVQFSTLPWWAMVTAEAFLAAYVVIHYSRRLRMAVTSRSVFSDMVGWIRAMWARIETWSPQIIADGTDPESKDYQEKRNANLLTLYALVSVLYFAATRLREVTRSSLDLYFIGSFSYTFVVTVIAFGLMYQGLENVLPGSFESSGRVLGLWTFMGFSFSTLIHAPTWGLLPTGSWALALSYVELIGSTILLLMFVFIILTSIRERYRDDAGRVADELRIAATRLASRIETQYGLTIVKTKSFLIEVNPDVVRMLVGLYDPEDVRAIEISSEDSNNRMPEGAQESIGHECDTTGLKNSGEPTA